MKYSIKIFLGLFLIGLTSIGFTQIPENYKLFAKIDAPKDLKWGIPEEIMVDSAKSLMVIAYDYNPTYLELYRIEDMKKLTRIKSRGHVYMDNCYFDLENNEMYIDKGRYKNRYVKYDLSTFKKKKVRCKDTPRGCPFERILDSETKYHGKYTYMGTEWYIIKFDYDQIEVYLTDQYVW